MDKWVEEAVKKMGKFTPTLYVHENSMITSDVEGWYVVDGERVYTRLKFVRLTNTEEMLKGQAFGL